MIHAGRICRMEKKEGGMTENMEKIEDLRIRKAQLESILVNHRDDYEPRELMGMETELKRVSYILNLWESFCSTPEDGDTGRIGTAWLYFPEGTPQEEIRGWFDETFGISVTEGRKKDAPEERNILVEISLVRSTSVSGTFMVSETELARLKNGDNPFGDELKRMLECNDPWYQYEVMEPDTGVVITSWTES